MFCRCDRSCKDATPGREDTHWLMEGPSPDASTGKIEIQNGINDSCFTSVRAGNNVGWSEGIIVEQCGNLRHRRSSCGQETSSRSPTATQVATAACREELQHVVAVLDTMKGVLCGNESLKFAPLCC